MKKSLDSNFIKTYIKSFIILDYRFRRWIFRKLYKIYSKLITKYLFLVNDVEYYGRIESNGIPIIDISKGSKLQIGELFRMNNGQAFNKIGRQQPCFFIANYGGVISIGKNVGLSSTAIICHKSVFVGNNVKIGGNTVIYDTDFHSITTVERISIPERKDNVVTRSVYIDDNVFIGAHTTVLKGVTIGRNSIIGAGSVVTKNVPSNQVWAGNPAVYIKDITLNKVGTIED